MSTTASIGLNQADYITINRTESSPSTAGASSTTTNEASSSKGQPSPSHNNEVTSSSSERLSSAATAPSNQDGGVSLSSSEERRKTLEEREQLVNHKSESVESESGQTGLTTPRGHVTGEALAATTRGVGVKGDRAVAGSSSKGGPPGGEVQLPAKQALAVLSNVSKNNVYCLF